MLVQSFNQDLIKRFHKHCELSLCSRLIYGFLGKHDAKKMLLDKVDGTFLLRFCEGTIEKSTKADNCGCLSVAVITTCDTSETFSHIQLFRSYLISQLFIHFILINLLFY